VQHTTHYEATNLQTLIYENLLRYTWPLSQDICKVNKEWPLTDKNSDFPAKICLHFEHTQKKHVICSTKPMPPHVYREQDTT